MEHNMNYKRSRYLGKDKVKMDFAAKIFIIQLTEIQNDSLNKKRNCAVFYYDTVSFLNRHTYFLIFPSHPHLVLYSSGSPFGHIKETFLLISELKA